MTADFKQLIIFPLIIFAEGRSVRSDLLHFTEFRSRKVSAGPSGGCSRLFPEGER